MQLFKIYVMGTAIITNNKIMILALGSIAWTLESNGKYRPNAILFMEHHLLSNTFHQSIQLQDFIRYQKAFFLQHQF